jgi:hypothetical protein
MLLGMLISKLFLKLFECFYEGYEEKMITFLLVWTCYGVVFRTSTASKSQFTANTFPPGNSASIRISFRPKYILQV